MIEDHLRLRSVVRHEKCSNGRLSWQRYRLSRMQKISFTYDERWSDCERTMHNSFVVVLFRFCPIDITDCDIDGCYLLLLLALFDNESRYP